jgi:hypothetical protein
MYFRRAAREAATLNLGTPQHVVGDSGKRKRTSGYILTCSQQPGKQKDITVS